MRLLASACVLVALGHVLVEGNGAPDIARVVRDAKAKHAYLGRLEAEIAALDQKRRTAVGPTPVDARLGGDRARMGRLRQDLQAFVDATRLMEQRAVAIQRQHTLKQERARARRVRQQRHGRRVGLDIVQLQTEIDQKTTRIANLLKAAGRPMPPPKTSSFFSRLMSPFKASGCIADDTVH